MNRAAGFPYDLAFDRNLGWLTEWEQLALRAKRVAIAGMGGVGGVYLLSLARLGVGAFTIADFDSFEFANFNRQVGAMTSTVGRPKAAVLEEMARDINPELSIRRFDAGVSPDSVDAFLGGAHLFVDGFDFFEIDIRIRVFARCREMGIPAITAAPIGMGVAWLVFTPTGMSFERYFRLSGQPAPEQYLRFLVGLAPRGLHRRYLVDPTRINLGARKAPSTVSGIQLCAGVTAAATVKLLLGRGGVKAAPWHHHFDAYRDRLSVTRLPFGQAGPVQRTRLALARRVALRGAGRPRPAAPDPPSQGRSRIEEILNLARWAPSGDNVQPWRFQILDDRTIVVRLRIDTDNVYEYRDGEPTVLAGGILIESMRIAASGWGQDARWTVEREATGLRITVHLVSLADAEPDPLLSFLTLRSVDRRPYRWRGLKGQEKSALAAAIGGAARLDWHESVAARWEMARLSGMATDIRLRCPEALPIHQRVIDWQQPLSPDRIPARSVGLPAPSLPLLRWALADWSHTERLNRFGGTWATTAQLDYLPALASGGFVVFRCPAAVSRDDRSVEQLLGFGSAIQRFWLTATRLGLVLQPSLATVAFAEYGQSRAVFTREVALRRKAELLAERFVRTLGCPPRDVLFIARVGEPRPLLPSVRSSRLPLDHLMEEATDEKPAADRVGSGL